MATVNERRTEAAQPIQVPQSQGSSAQQTRQSTRGRANDLKANRVEIRPLVSRLGDSVRGRFRVELFEQRRGGLAVSARWLSLPSEPHKSSGRASPTRQEICARKRRRVA